MTMIECRMNKKYSYSKKYARFGLDCVLKINKALQGFSSGLSVASKALLKQKNHKLCFDICADCVKEIWVKIKARQGRSRRLKEFMLLCYQKYVFPRRAHDFPIAEWLRPSRNSPLNWWDCHESEKALLGESSYHYYATKVPFSATLTWNWIVEARVTHFESFWARRRQSHLMRW